MKGADTLPLFIVVDGGKLFVARQRPVIDGAAEPAVTGSIVELKLLPRTAPLSSDPGVRLSTDSTVSDAAPGMDAARRMAVLGALAAVATAVVVGIWLTFWISVPLGIGVAVYTAWAYLRREAMVAEAWRDNHRILTHHDDKRMFADALATSKQIVKAWPRVARLVDISDPSPALAQSLWDLAETLDKRARMRDQQRELQQVQINLPPDVRVRDEVADRLAQVGGVLGEINADVARRMLSINAIAEECQRFVREQQAIAQARDAVRSADQALGIVGVPGSAVDLSDELGARTRGILNAYRDLTRDMGSDEMAG